MKTFVCLAALSLMACGAPFEEGKNPIDNEGEAGSDTVGVGGSDPIGNPQAGKAGTPTGGTDSGMAGSSLGGNSGTGTAGQGSAGIGMAGMPSAGTGSAGMGSAGSGMGGSDSPVAGTGGTDSAGSANAGTGNGGSGGMDVTPIDECSEEGREGNWTAPVWNWNDSVKTTACLSQINRIGKSVLTLEVPAGCDWEDPETGHWDGCMFTSTLVCQPIPGGQAFTVQVIDVSRAAHVDGSSKTGSLSGTIFFKAETAGGCSELATNSPNGSMSFSADRY